FGTQFLIAFLKVPPQVGKSGQFFDKFPLLGRFRFDQLVPLVSVFYWRKIPAFLEAFEQPCHFMEKFLLRGVVCHLSGSFPRTGYRSACDVCLFGLRHFHSTLRFRELPLEVFLPLVRGMQLLLQGADLGDQVAVSFTVFLTGASSSNIFTGLDSIFW